MPKEDSKVKQLEIEVSQLKRKMHEKSQGSDDFCCGCCLGLAAGFMLFDCQSPEDYGTGRYQSPKDLNAVVEQAKPANPSFLLRQIENYQANISPRLKEELGVERLCKYTPSCSEYAREAIEAHGPVKGSLMAAARLARCNPLSPGGYDPIK